MARLKVPKELKKQWLEAGKGLFQQSLVCAAKVKFNQPDAGMSLVSTIVDGIEAFANLWFDTTEALEQQKETLAKSRKKRSAQQYSIIDTQELLETPLQTQTQGDKEDEYITEP